MSLYTVQKALDKSRVLNTIWLEDKWENTINDEIMDIYIIVDEVEPNLKILVTIKLKNIWYTVPLEDVTDLTCPNKILHLQTNDLYLDWQQRILENLGELSRRTTFKDPDGSLWFKKEYSDDLGNTRIVRERAKL